MKQLFGNLINLTSEGRTIVVVKFTNEKAVLQSYFVCVTKIKSEQLTENI